MYENISTFDKRDFLSVMNFPSFAVSMISSLGCSVLLKVYPHIVECRLLVKANAVSPDVTVYTDAELFLVEVLRLFPSYRISYSLNLHWLVGIDVQ